MISEKHARRDGTGDDRPVDAATANDAGADTATDGYWRIEPVAARTGLSKRTLRYYEEIGLLAPPTRTEGGYRLYSEADIQHLQRIKRLRDLLGFSLKEIREIAQAQEQREQVKAAFAAETDPHTRIAWIERAEELTRSQLALVEEKLAGLQEMHTNLLVQLRRQAERKAQLLQEESERR
jgi:MerR family transcriptional regulator, repressor of the yfmOP operon